MGWEYRRGNRYYYRKKREGGKVVSEYVGGGRFRELIADYDANARELKTIERIQDQLMREDEEEIDRRLKEIERHLKKITQETLKAAGFHNHKGQWRKKRHDRKITSD